MNTKRFLLVIGFIFSHSIGFSQSYDYHYQRTIYKVTDTWHIITLPNDIYGKVSDDLADIKIICMTNDGDTLEMPYLMRPNIRQVVDREIPFKQINQSHLGNNNYFTFYNSSKTLLNQIRLDFSNKNFDWKVTLQGSDDQQQWFTILENYRLLSIKNAYSNYNFTTLNFPEVNYRYLRLAIPEAEKPTLNSASLNDQHIEEGKYQIYQIGSMNISNDHEKQQTIVEINLLQKVPVASLAVKVNDTLDYYRPISIQYVTDSFNTEQGIHYN